MRTRLRSCKRNVERHRRAHSPPATRLGLMAVGRAQQFLAPRESRGATARGLRSRIFIVRPLALLLTVVMAARLSAADDNAWGTLTGRFVTGPAGQEAAEPQGVSGIAIYIEPAKDRKLSIHPKYAAEKRRSEERTIEIRDSRFVPDLVFLRTNQPLVVKNADTIRHAATRSPRPGESPAFPGILSAGESRRFQFSDAGWQSIVCNLHDHPHAYLVVQPHPYGAVTGADGRFVIEDLPVGEHTFRVWRPSTGYIRQAKLAGTPVAWKRGLARFTIRPARNDLGEIQVSTDRKAP